MSISSWTRDRLRSRTNIANTDVPAETLPDRGRTAFVATIPVPASPSGGHSGTPGGSRPEGSSSLRPIGGQRSGVAPGRQDGGQDVPQLPAQPACRDVLVEPRDARRVPVTRRGVDGEHARRLADAHHVLAREPPVDVAREGGEVRDPGDVRLPLEDRLVEVGDAPALRHRELEQRGQLGAGATGGVVAPRSEGHEELAARIERDVPVHHRAEAHGRHGLELDLVAGADVRDERRVTRRQARPDVVHVVRPDAIPELVLPGVGAGGQRGRVRRDERGLDAGRAELDPEDAPSRPDQPGRTATLLVHRGSGRP